MAVRRRPKLKFFVILGLFAAIIAIVLILVLRGQPTAAIEIAETKYEATFDMLIVRDEVVYEAKNYGQTKFIAVEGEPVNVGDPIIEVYEWGYNDQTLSALLDLQKDIMKYETEVSRADVIDQPLNEINDRITAKADQIRQAVENDQPDLILGLERDMEALLDERLSYLRSVVVPDAQLREYYSKEQALLEQIEGWRSKINAKESGIVSFYFDGVEALMAKENIGSFTKEALEEVLEGKTIEVPDHDHAFAPLYRVVNENEWYVVLLSEEKIPEMYVGNGFSLVFNDYLETQYTGVVSNATVLENKEGFVYTILIKDNIGPLLGERRVTARLLNVQQGMRVPRSCVKETEQVNYVETVEGDIVPVIIVADAGEYVFIQTYKDQAQLQVGQLLKK